MTSQSEDDYPLLPISNTISDANLYRLVSGFRTTFSLEELKDWSQKAVVSINNVMFDHLHAQVRENQKEGELSHLREWWNANSFPWVSGRISQKMVIENGTNVILGALSCGGVHVSYGPGVDTLKSLFLKLARDRETAEIRGENIIISTEFRVIPDDMVPKNNESQVMSNSGGDISITESERLSSDGCLSVSIKSYDPRGIHRDLGLLVGKRVRIIVEVMED